MMADIFGFRNKIHNGKMEVAQRGTSFTAASGYTLDRWSYSQASSATIDLIQSADSPNSEFQFSLRTTVTTADTAIAAGDICQLLQRVEGYNARDLIGRTFTLSFFVRSSKTGVHCIALTNSGQDRSYICEYTVSVANTWERKTITVTGGLISAGTWNWTNGTGLSIYFTLMSGTTFQTNANEWKTGQFRATANQVNCVDTVGNIFAITGIQLEVGSVATAFEHKPYSVEFSLCQRYFQRLARLLAYGQASNGILIPCMLPVPMRTTPTGSLTTTTPYWESVVYSTIGSLTAATINLAHFSASGGTILINGTFSPAPTYGSMSEFDGNSILLTADL